MEVNKLGKKTFLSVMLLPDLVPLSVIYGGGGGGGGITIWANKCFFPFQNSLSMAHFDEVVLHLFEVLVLRYARSDPPSLSPQVIY